MPENLRARLKRIRNSGRISGRDSFENSVNHNDKNSESVSQPDASWPLWHSAGFKTLKRELCKELSFPLPAAFSGALPILIPDLARIRNLKNSQNSLRVPSAEELLFFDLETTGLSGGAGTIAFLAAFGRFDTPANSAAGKNAVIRITQYLLLDYPSECDFIGQVLKEFAPIKRNLPVVVSYNGKCFDSQILKNRCLMNGTATPEYYHADLLHPARRLWKRVLPDCSQKTVETEVLHLDRSGDVSGALAPEIWFSFLKSDDNRELLGVCDHNVRDIQGLASIFFALEEIAVDPLGCCKKFIIDPEALALTWKAAVRNNEHCRSYTETGEMLLKNAAENGYPRAAIVAAIDAEWKLKDPALALNYTKYALGNKDIPESLKPGLEKRLARLERKTKN